MSKVPMPGDAVVLTGYYDCLTKEGDIAILDGVVGEPKEDYLACFGYSCFRGPANGKYGGKEIVSCSGGPAPRVKASDLKPTDRTVRITCWRWKDTPCRNGGESYSIHVPVWEWTGK